MTTNSKTNSSQYDILLIVDDLATIRLLTSYFESKGYSCHGVVSGSKGLEELGRTSPKVILLEIDSLNGYDICKMIKSDKEYKKIPIYFLTAISGSKSGFDWPTGGWGTGYFRDDHYINKPFSLTDFEVIFDILNRFKLEKQEPYKPFMIFKIDESGNRKRLNITEDQFRQNNGRNVLFDKSTGYCKRGFTKDFSLER